MICNENIYDSSFHYLLQVVVAECIPRIPAHTEQDDPGLEVTQFERILLDYKGNFSIVLKQKPSLPYHQHFCNIWYSHYRAIASNFRNVELDAISKEKWSNVKHRQGWCLPGSLWIWSKATATGHLAICQTQLRRPLAQQPILDTALH